MTPRQWGLLSRAIGPIIQILGIILFFTGQQTGRAIWGIGLNTLGLILVGIGLVFVIAGLYFSFHRRAKPSESADESEYRLRL